MTHDRFCSVDPPYVREHASTGEPIGPQLASVIDNPRWAALLNAADDDERALATAWDVFRAALARCDHGPDERNATRRQIATTLITAAARITR